MTESQTIALYNEFHQPVFHACLRILHDSLEAEECMQDAFIKLFALDRDAFANQAACFSWVRKVAVRLAIDRLRSLDFRMEKQHDTLDNRTSLTEDETGAAGGSGAGLENQVAAVKTALDALPSGYRTIMSLYLFEGYDYDEIAQITHLRPSSVRSQYARGRQKIQEILQSMPSWTL